MEPTVDSFMSRHLRMWIGPLLAGHPRLLTQAAGSSNPLMMRFLVSAAPLNILGALGGRRPATSIENTVLWELR